MGAGMSQEAIAAAVRNNLRRYQTEFKKMGIVTHIERGRLSGDLNGKHFVVWFRIIRASNAEVAGLVNVTVSFGDYPGTNTELGVSFIGTVAENVQRLCNGVALMRYV